ncbi:MAG: rod shape-determining protein RodA [Gammaproteobacteria bacterium]|nr:rod shape-determining protein RodA [Gammaproteobacteria bacterium]
MREQDQTLAYRLHIDMPLLLGLIVLSAVGLLVLYSAGGQSNELLTKQVVRLGVAFGVMFVVAQIGPSHYQYWSPWIYGIGLILLVLVLVAGDQGKGAQRWLDIGFVRFQPSELVKISVPMMVAYYLSERPIPPTWQRVLIGLAAVLLPTVLIARQPDLGTALLVASAGLFVLFLAGIPWRAILGSAAIAVASLPIMMTFLHDYQRQRVETFLNPERDPLGSGYHIIQSKIAIGSGGLYGKGWLNGTQSQLDFLPERSTDFVFAVLSEEFGLLGVAIVLAIYGFVVARGMYIAMNAQETFGRLLGGGLVMTFFVYVFVNIGMVSGLMPVVGLPLPLISYGGTSMVTMLAAFGLLMSVHTHRRLLSE